MILKSYLNAFVLSVTFIIIVSCDKGTEPPVVSIPVVTTTQVTNATSSSASTGGNITSDGGSTVTARGVCWSINSNPTIIDNATSDGTGTGSFASSLTGLLANTTYYVRAYATNSVGTGYGNIISFTTTSSTNSIGLPILKTTTVSGITSSTAVSGGNITSDGGSAITERGICWSTNLSPTINDNITTDGAGLGNYTSTITGLVENTLYSIRAYATNSSGTGYGSPRTIYATSLSSQLAYLGQTPPGRELIPFARNIIGTWQHGEVTVSPDGQEIYWTNDRSILFSKIVNGRWTTPAVASFSGQANPYGNFPYDDNPVVSPDNSKLFFTSFRPMPYNSPNQENIWYAERTSTGWGEPQPLPQNVNSIPNLHWQISITNDGTIYFGANYTIFFTRYINGVYTDPQEVSVVNSFGGGTNPFIAPDESYIIFTNMGGTGTYISFKDKNGLWLPPQLIAQLQGTCFVTRDGKYIFSWFHWISADIIEELRPSN